MSIPLLCLLGFAGWTLALVVAGIGAIRVFKVLSGQARPNQFPADEPHGSPAYRRLMRAHANCVENLPIFATLVLVTEVLGRRDPLFDSLAMAILVARVGQSVAHISSGRSLVINVRFVMFSTQVVAFVWWGLRLVL